MSNSIKPDIRISLSPRWILLVDPEITGHHGTYLRLLSQAFLRLGYHVCVLSSVYPQWFRVNRTGSEKELRFMRISELTFSSFRSKRCRRTVRGFYRWAVLIMAVRRARRKFRGTMELVFLSYLDGYLVPSLFHFSQYLLPARWSGLYVAPIEALPKRRKRYVPIGRILAKKKCTGIFTLVRNVTRRYGRTYGKLIWLPDISDNSINDKQYSSVEAIKAFHDRTIVGMVGAIARRKAVVQLVQAAELSQKEGLPIAFVIAGRFERGSFTRNEQRYLRETRGRISNLVWWPYFIEEETEFNAIVSSCDVLFAAYPGFYMSSNMLAKSASFGKQVIALQDTYVGAITEKYGLGVTVPTITPEAILTAVLKASVTKLDSQIVIKRSRFKLLHSEAAFDRALCTVLSPTGFEENA